MPGYMSFDQETSIQSYVKTLGIKKDGKVIKKRIIDTHGGLAKDPRNDVYTIIYGTHPNRIKLLHSKKGFKRRLPFRVKCVLDNTHTIIGSNLKFDLSYIWKDPYFKNWLLKGGKIWDIQLVRYLLSAQVHQFPSLAEMQKIYLGIKTKKDKISYLFSKGIGADKIIYAGRNKRPHYRIDLRVESIGNNLIIVPKIQYRERAACKRLWKLYCEYGVEDGRTPMLIMQKQYKIAKQQGMLPIIEMYNRYLLALTMIECNGLHINMALAEQRVQEFTLTQIELLRKAEDIVRKYWKDKRLPPLNLNSGQHKSVLLFGGIIEVDVIKGTGEFVKTKSSINYGKEKTKKVKEQIKINGFGLSTTLTEKLKTGYYATGADIIEKIYKRSNNTEAIEYCRLVKEADGYRQKISTYLSAFTERSINGILYPNYNNCATVTSRLSASQPNVQNIPKHGKFYKLIQGLIIAPEGWTCCQIDFSQLEVYCRALLSNDPALINDLASGVDFHCQNMAWGSGITYPSITYKEAIQYAKIDEIPEWVERRSQSKPISFGEAYGQMEESMAQATGLPREVVDKIYQNMRDNYPDIVQFEEKVKEEVALSGRLLLQSELGRDEAKGVKNSKGIGRKFQDGIELLPIRSRCKKFYSTEYGEFRHVGYYKSPTGKLYAFPEYGSRKQDGGIFRYYKPTQMKNYPMQGTAGDIQAITTAEMFIFLLQNEDRVKIVNEIHDSKWFLIKNEHVISIVPKLCSIMNNTSQLLLKQFNIRVPFDFKCDAEVGPNFAELKSFKKVYPGVS